MLIGLILACETKPDIDLPRYEDTGDADTDTDADTDADTDTDVEPAWTDHCGDVRVDETWRAADNPHRLSCEVTVLGATLTIEAGVSVEVDDSDGLTVGDRDYGGSLVVAGTADSPVGFRALASDDPGVWEGITLTELTDAASLSWVTIAGAGGAGRGALYAQVPVRLDHVTVEASGDHGIELVDGGAFAEGSTALTVHGLDAASFPVVVPAATAASLPIADLAVGDNPQPVVFVEDGTVAESGTWSDPGVPYLVGGTVDVEGTADHPAILTIGPGTTLQVERSGGFRLAPTGGAAGLRALGTEADPVLFTAFGSEVAGYWDGIQGKAGTLGDAFILTHTTVAYAGASTSGGAVLVEDADLLADHLTILGSLGYGLALDGSASLAAGSGDLVVHACLRPATVPAHAVGTLDGLDVSFADTTEPQLVVVGDTVSEAATWPALDVPYWVEGKVNVDGTVPSPAVLTLTAGTTFYMANDSGFFIGRNGGASALVARGTADAPIVFRPGEAELAGAWSGIGLYDASDDTASVFDHVDIGYGGGTTLSGDLHLDGASPAVDHTTLHDSEQYGLYLTGGATPTLGEVTYAGNATGDTN